MKKSIFLSITLIAAILTFVGCKKNHSGETKTEIRSVGSFSAIDVSDAISVYVTKGDTEEVKVEANSAYLNHVLTKVNGETLEISVDRSFRLLKSYKEHEIKVYLTMNTLSGINASGASRVSGTGIFEQENLNIDLSGASELDFSGLNINSIFIEGSGASSITLSGTTKTLRLSDLSGASKLNAFNFTSDYATLNLSGASEANISVTSDLNVTASGASVVKYIGNPQTINQNLSGSSTLIKI